HHLGALAIYRRDIPSARGWVEESLAISRENEDGFDSACNLVLLGEIEAAEGHIEKARTIYHEALPLFSARTERRGIAMCLEGLAELQAEGKEERQAARLFGAAHALRNQIGAGWNPYERLTHEAALAELRASLGEAAFAAAWAEGGARGAD